MESAVPGPKGAVFLPLLEAALKGEFEINC